MPVFWTIWQLVVRAFKASSMRILALHIWCAFTIACYNIAGRQSVQLIIN